MGEITLILSRVQKGDPQAAEELVPLVYDELRQLAAHKLSQEKPGQTLQPTALVHEAWLRLVGTGEGEAETRWNDRRHFFNAAAEAMRRILIDNARRKLTVRHGGLCQRVEVEKLQLAAEMPSEELLVVDDALARFTKVDPQAAELVRLRFYAGFSQHQVADVLGVSHRVADRLWAFARAWLFAEIRKDYAPHGNAN